MDEAVQSGFLPTTVLHSLTDGACRTIDDLAESLKLTRRQVSDGAAKLVLRGLLERIEAGCYQLTSSGISAAAAGEVIKSGPWRPDTVTVRKPLPDTFRQRLWTAMRMSKTFTIGEVAMIAARAGDESPENNAAWYVRHLRQAQYVVELPVRQQGTRLTSNGFKRYRLLKDTGFLAPVYQPKKKSVFDHNTGEAVSCAKPT
ncbi:MarR family transcriptional regulator [Rhizobium ruizarguesonis]